MSGRTQRRSYKHSTKTKSQRLRQRITGSQHQTVRKIHAPDLWRQEEAERLALEQLEMLRQLKQMQALNGLLQEPMTPKERLRALLPQAGCFSGLEDDPDLESVLDAMVKILGERNV